MVLALYAIENALTPQALDGAPVDLLTLKSISVQLLRGGGEG